MPLTATSVELTFDPKLTEAIRSVWNELTLANIQYQHHPVQALPHLSLAIRDLSGDDPKPPFLALAKKLRFFADGAAKKWPLARGSLKEARGRA